MQITLSPLDNQLIKRHLNLLDHVLESINTFEHKERIDLELAKKTIEELKEEIKVGKEEDLPSLYYQLNLQFSLLDKFAGQIQIPSPKTPYFGQMKLKVGEEERTILIGDLFYLPKGSEFKILDWKTSPMARVFYDFEAGDDFELDLERSNIEGKILEKNLLTIINGKLVRIDYNNTALIENGTWEKLDLDPSFLKGGEGTSLGLGLTDYKGPEVTALLDSKQFNLLHESEDTPLLITGSAGSGKTTVIVHRIASLLSKTKLKSADFLILVPTTGLNQMTQSLLLSLNINRVKSFEVTKFLYELYKNLTKSKLKINYEEDNYSITSFKRKPQIMDLIDSYYKNKSNLIEKVIISISKEAHQQFQKYPEMPLIKKLSNLKNSASLTSTDKIKISRLILDESKIEHDFFDLFTAKGQLEKLNNDILNKRTLEDLIIHTSKQMQSQVGGEDIKGIDGKSSKQNYNDRFNSKLDVVDIPILLSMYIKKFGGLQSDHYSFRQIKQLVLDEAQELTAIELNVFSHLLSEDDSSVMIAGDGVQQVSSTSEFLGWNNIVKMLGFPNLKVNELKVSYRSPQTIVDFTQHLLGKFAPIVAPSSKKTGAPVLIEPLGHEGLGLTRVFKALESLVAREKKARVGIICKNESDASNVYNSLASLPKTRFITDAVFSFKPGIDITTVSQIRGLEFDYVIIPDASSKSYKDNFSDRKQFHLAATRAIHQLWVLYSGEVSPIIKDYKEGL